MLDSYISMLVRAQFWQHFIKRSDEPSVVVAKLLEVLFTQLLQNGYITR